MSSLLEQRQLGHTDRTIYNAGKGYLLDIELFPTGFVEEVSKRVEMRNRYSFDARASIDLAADAILEFRLETGMGQAEYAELLNVPPEFVVLLESGLCGRDEYRDISEKTQSLELK